MIHSSAVSGLFNNRSKYLLIRALFFTLDIISTAFTRSPDSMDFAIGSVMNKYNNPGTIDRRSTAIQSNMILFLLAFVPSSFSIAFLFSSIEYLESIPAI